MTAGRLKYVISSSLSTGASANSTACQTDREIFLNAGFRRVLGPSEKRYIPQQMVVTRGKVYRYIYLIHCWGFLSSCASTWSVNHSWCHQTWVMCSVSVQLLQQSDGVDLELLQLSTRLECFYQGGDQKITCIQRCALTLRDLGSLRNVVVERKTSNLHVFWLWRPKGNHRSHRENIWFKCRTFSI